MAHPSPFQVNVYQAKTQLSKLLDAVERGERVVIARAGRPVADLVRHEPRPVGIEIGCMADEVEFDDDEFAAADTEIARLFYG